MLFADASKIIRNWFLTLQAGNQNSYTDFISEVINIDFWQIWYFDVKGTGGGWVWNLGKLWEDSICE